MTKMHLTKMTRITPDNDHDRVFRDFPIIGIGIGAKNFKDILVRAKITQIKKEGWCGPCKGPRCKICKDFVFTSNFASFATKRTYEIRSKNLNCRSKSLVYLVSCKTFHK